MIDPAATRYRSEDLGVAVKFAPGLTAVLEVV